MPITAETKISKDSSGNQEEKLLVEFTNGALQQIKDLAEFYEVPKDDLPKLIQLGISMLELLRQNGQVGQKDSTIHNGQHKQ